MGTPRKEDRREGTERRESLATVLEPERRTGGERRNETNRQDEADGQVLKDDKPDNKEGNNG